MMGRQIQWGKHVAALVITVLIFSVGLLVGVQVSSSRVALVEQLGREQRADIESLQLQYLFLQSSTQKNQTCAALQRTLDQSVERLENARVKLEGYLQNIALQEYLETKRDYILNEIRYWLLSQQAAESCGMDVVTVLFFYRRDDVCEDCSSQGVVLTSLKEQFGERLMIFSFDMDFDEEMVRLLSGVYGVDESPSVVVGSKLMPGFAEREALEGMICDTFLDNTGVLGCPL